MHKRVKVALVVLAVPALFILLRTPVMEGKLLGGLRPYYTLFFPPGDLYEPLVRIRIDPRRTGEAYKFTVTPRYVGNYDAGFYVEKEFNYQERPRWDSRFSLVCGYHDNAAPLALEMGEKASPFLGLRGNGFALAWFKVPETLPQGEVTNCEFRVIKGGNELPDLYGHIEFYVAKSSDL